MVRWLSIDEVRYICGGIGRATVYRWVRLGRLPKPQKIGGNGSRTARWNECAVRKQLNLNVQENGNA